jgi:uncharacterized protein (TIRG00374 family)
LPKKTHEVIFHPITADIVRLTFRSLSVVIVKCLLSAALIAYLLSEISVLDTWREAKQLSAVAALTVVLLLMLYTVIAAGRWLIVLRSLGADATAISVTQITFTALLLNQFLPATIGADAYRLWELSRRGLTINVAFSSVLLERAVHLVGLSLFAAIATTAWGLGRMPEIMVWALWGIFGASAFCIGILTLISRVPHKWIPKAVRRPVIGFGHDVQTFFSAPIPCIATAFLVIVGQGIFSAAVLVLGRSLGASISFVDCLAFLPAVLLVTSLPVSVSGWGVREFTIVTVFGYAGLSAPLALALSLILGVFTILAAMPGGIVWLVQRSSVSDRISPSKKS